MGATDTQRLEKTSPPRRAARPLAQSRHQEQAWRAPARWAPWANERGIANKKKCSMGYKCCCLSRRSINGAAAAAWRHGGSVSPSETQARARASTAASPRAPPFYLCRRRLVRRPEFPLSRHCPPTTSLSIAMSARRTFSLSVIAPRLPKVATMLLRINSGRKLNFVSNNEAIVRNERR